MRFLKKVNIFVLIIFINGCTTTSIKSSNTHAQKKASNEVEYKKTSFDILQNWSTANQLKSFNAFKKSCTKMLEEKQPEYSDWMPVCEKALNAKFKTTGEARLFFENNFYPYQVIYKNKDTGLFTGYYEPTIKGSLVKTLEYTTPIYKTPSDLVKKPNNNDTYTFGMYQDGKLVPYHSREEISQGQLFSKKDVLVWVHSKVDRTFLQIQGSGRIETDSGDILIGYDSQNGHPYRPIGKYLLDHGYMSAKEISMQSIKAWLNKNEDKTEEVLNYDPSFVFFRYLDRKNAVGAQDVELTPGYSLAVDDQYYYYGIPMWLETDYYKNNHHETAPLDRLMIAQDTGGAILGAIRGDVFWGHGKQAEFNAGHMNNRGKLWILLPKNLNKYEAH